MAKRKRNGPLKSQEDRPSEYEDRQGSSLNIRSFEDVADSEDDFHVSRDKVLLEDQPKSKRQRQDEDEEAFLEPSDEEVFDRPEDDSDSAPDDDDEEDGGIGVPDLEVDGDQDDDVVSEDSETNWGGDKSAYYNADDITNEEDAQAEATEARRIQQKQLQGLSEADFGLDEDAWAGAAAAAEDEDRDGRHVEKLPPLQLTPGMSDEEKRAILTKRYPDFEQFSHDLVDLESRWQSLRTEYKNAQADGSNTATILLAQLRAVSTYLGALSMYFAVLTSPAQQGGQDANGVVSQALPMPPNDLRDHGVLDAVKEARDLWELVGDLQPIEETEPMEAGDVDMEAELEDESAEQSDLEEPVSLSTTKQKPVSSKKAAALARTEASLAELDRRLALSAAQPQQTTRPPRASARVIDNDLGDEAPLDDEEAAEKSRKRKSLRFYTSQIAQRQNKRAGAAARATQGDDDLPHRERWRDRIERLNREAEARGRARQDAADDDNDAEDDGGATNAERLADNDDAEYAALTGAAARKKGAKASREAAYAAARASNGALRVVRRAADDAAPDGRREIGYAIAANKGLTPKRSKANKNPRVKKRRRYEDKTKKLRSMKPTYRGGEGRGGYGGELTGIKKGTVRAVKF